MPMSSRILSGVRAMSEPSAMRATCTSSCACCATWSTSYHFSVSCCLATIAWTRRRRPSLSARERPSLNSASRAASSPSLPPVTRPTWPKASLEASRQKTEAPSGKRSESVGVACAAGASSARTRLRMHMSVASLKRSCGLPRSSYSKESSSCTSASGVFQKSSSVERPPCRRAAWSAPAASSVRPLRRHSSMSCSTTTPWFQELFASVLPSAKYLQSAVCTATTLPR
mmetsp:Transcript_55844/g.164014  ORF Transcript_55844/g.164014 Transcript_55844/m.164014 type:complete len:228 (+) Transcript_55844:577-1260(+)